MFDKFKKSSAAARLIEEKIYEQVVAELASGQKRDGLWAKALANSGGIEGKAKAKALYIQYRVQSIKDEAEVSAAIANEEEYLRKNAPVIERQKRIDSAEAILNSKGYKLRVKGSGWVIKEPLGGQQPIDSLEELEQYAKTRD